MHISPAARPRARRPPWVVECRIEETELEGDHGMVAGIEATCSACGHVTESFGTEEGSVRRCLALMHDECPSQSGRFYVAAS